MKVGLLNVEKNGEDKERLVHLSLDLDITEEFFPRIPSENVMIDNEDNETPRICLGKNIRGCLTAVPWGGNTFEDLFFDNGKSQLIRVYEFDRKDILPGNLVTSTELYQSDRVRDAEISEEVWVINQSIKPVKTYIIQITDYSEGSADDIKYEDLKNYNEEEDDLGDIINGCFTTIEWIVYDTLMEEAYEEKIGMNFKVKSVNGADSSLIYDRISKFIEQYWDDYSIDVEDTEEEGWYLVDGLVELYKKPTTKTNFTELLEDDIKDVNCAKIFL